MTTPQTKILLLEQEILSYENTVYLMGVRARGARITDNKPLEDEAQKQIETCMKMIDFLNAEKEKVEGEKV